MDISCYKENHTIAYRHKFLNGVVVKSNTEYRSQLIGINDLPNMDGHQEMFCKKINDFISATYKEKTIGEGEALIFEYSESNWKAKLKLSFWRQPEVEVFEKTPRWRKIEQGPLPF